MTVNVRGGDVHGMPEALAERIDCEVRGEVVMLRSDWRAYNDAHPGRQLANPRTAAAGTLLAKDRTKVAQRPVRFYAFDLIRLGDRLAQRKLADELTELGSPSRATRSLLIPARSAPTSSGSSTAAGRLTTSSTAS